MIIALTLCCSCMQKGGGDASGNEIDEAVKSINLDADSNYQGSLLIAISGQESEINTINALVSAFNEQYPYITVKINQYPLDGYYGSIRNNASYAFSKGEYGAMEDVFWFAQDYLDVLYDLNILFPLGKIIEKDDSFDLSSLMDESVSVSEIDGTLYLMPRDYNQVVMYFNQEIFDAAGVDYPTAKMSKDDFMTMLSELKTGLEKSDATNGYGVPYKTAVKYLVDVNSCWDSWCWPLIKQFGGEVINANGESALNSQETKNAVYFWKQLKDLGYFEKCQTTNSGVNFRMQQSAVYFQARACLSDLLTTTKQVKGVKKLGVTAIPQFGTNYAVGGGSSGYGMYKYAVNKTAAWLFLKFVVSEAGQNAFSKTGNCVPVLKSLITDENAAWRTYTHENLGSAFDNDAFVYMAGSANSPFSSTRDFYKYIPNNIQSDVLMCIQSVFAGIDDAKSNADVAEAIENQAGLISYYIGREKNKQ